MINVVCPDQQALHAQRVWERFQPSPHRCRGPTGPFLQRPVQPHHDISRVKEAASQLPYRSSRISKRLFRHQTSLQASRKETEQGVRPVDLVPRAKSDGLLHQQDHFSHIYSLASLMAAHSMVLRLIILLRYDVLSFLLYLLII